MQICPGFHKWLATQFHLNNHNINSCMNITLLKGTFSKEETFYLIQELIKVKIKFHEDKIQKIHQEEDIKMRENRIKELQRSLDELKSHLKSVDTSVQLSSTISIQSA